MLVKSLCIAYKIETLDFEIFRDREITPDPAAFLAADGLLVSQCQNPLPRDEEG